MVVVPIFVPVPILVLPDPVVLILVAPLIVAPPVPVKEPVPALMPTPDIEPALVDMLPLAANELTLLIAPLLDTVTPFKDKLVELAEDIVRDPVEVKLGVVTLVENVGLFTVPTVRVPPNETVPPPVTFVPLVIVTELFCRAVLATVPPWMLAPFKLVRLAPLPLNDAAVTVPVTPRVPVKLAALDIV